MIVLSDVKGRLVVGESPDVSPDDPASSTVLDREAAVILSLEQVRGLLGRALLNRCDLRQADISVRLGVSEGRVSQVLNGRADPSIATLARYLRVLGYQLKLTAVPVEPGVPPIDPIRVPQSAEVEA